MAGFQEVMKYKKRMCEQIFSCSKCPLYSIADKEKVFCIDFLTENPKESEEIIMKWASEHPVKTNADKLK